MCKGRKTAVAVLCLLLVIIASTTHAEEIHSKKETLASRIESIINRDTSGGTWAVEVASLDTGETLYGKNSWASMIPASNMKLYTTAAALEYLGTDFTVKTSIYFDGELGPDGVLNGNLILYGRGDPNISGRFYDDDPAAIFKQMVESLKTQGLREIKGDVIGDDSYFDAEYYGPWPPEEAHKWYAARVSALSLNDNCIDIYVAPGPSPGAKARVSQTPWTSYLRVINRASTTTKKSNSVWISPLEKKSAVVVGGRIWNRKRIEVLWFPVESPPLYAVTVFKETLQRKGIPVSGTARALGPDHASAVPMNAEPIIEHESLPLSEMIKVVNKRSQNLHAELLLKHMGLHKGYGPTFEGGTRAVREFLRTKNMDSGATVIFDGSGLCRSNRTSAHAIVQLLQHMDSSPWRDVFKDSLAAAGVDNSLRSMRWIRPRNKIRAKTGSLKNVLSLSGYADGRSERLAFSIIVNGFGNNSQKVKEVRDEICAELVRY
jgi:D-alanyl-D-alanine carboxypeptidase/D-alanyl-D-alanine-endopeptidase (penicillin-binding protein 4)